MSFLLGQRPDRDDLDNFPKVARQHVLAEQGVRVPPGVVLDLEVAQELFAPDAAVEDPALSWVRAELEAGHTLIARSAGCSEDRDHTSGAGLGMSLPGLRSVAELEGALGIIESHGRSLVEVGKLEASRTLMLVQREVPRRALLVVVRGAELGDRFYVEEHGAESGPEPLAEGRSPEWAGPLSEWEDASREAVEELASQVAASEAGTHGVDLELVVDPQNQPWLVQARPLTAPLHPGWPAFSEAVARAGQQKHMRGSLILDGEHNPAPLSPAHQWIMRRLAKARPNSSGDPVVLAGWLYMRELPRDLGAGASEVMPVREALLWLRDEALPNARLELEDFEDALEEEPPIAEALERAEELFLTMIDSYVTRLVPARKAAMKRFPKASLEEVEEHSPLSLRARAHFLDVLPAVWDVASPSLADLLDELEEEEEDPELPEGDLAAVRLLGEWDDHLFACGLAPLRELWRYAAARLDVALADVFLLDGDELIALDQDPLALGHRDELEAELDRRAALLDEQYELNPPCRIVDGQPLPQAFGGRLRGLAIGVPFEGPIAQRRDLRELLADPPEAGAILCIPSLTAQAAVALSRLGIKAVCTEYGGALAHGALMARELGMSALIGCTGCTGLAEGTRAHVDTRARRLVAGD